jgi:hypothetical protein
MMVYICTLSVLSAFQFRPRSLIHPCCGSHNNIYLMTTTILSAIDNDNEQDVVPPSVPPSGEEGNALCKELQQRHEEIKIEKTRCALEEQHTKSFLKSRPRKLPYQQARWWVQNNIGIDTKDEWEDFLEMGYIKSSYIPNDPEAYYTLTREWISWDHFLKGIGDDDGDHPIAVDPRRGVFD